MLDNVRHLLALEAAQLEAAESEGQESLLTAAERVLDKLGTHLSKRIGQEGFRTLLARALALTKAPFPSFRTVRVEENGSLTGLREAAEVSEGAAALLVRFLELLVTFIGEDLTLQMLGAVWPELDKDGAADEESERP